ncbi:MAG: hypothetical protein AAF337_15360 [Pseudomonadota bacterium]
MMRLGALAALLCLFFGPAGAESPARRYSLSDAAARPVVRVLVDDSAQGGRFRNGTGVLVGRCDVMLTAKHVLAVTGVEQLQVYSPQLRGKAVAGVVDAAAQHLRNGDGDDPAGFDDDVAVVRLAACPTHHFVPFEQIKPLQFQHLKQLRSAGFACDSSHQRAPEIIRFTGRVASAPVVGGLSRQVRLVPGARPGQSGAPVFSFSSDSQQRALHMLLVATVRTQASPVGCGVDENTGQSAAGHAAFGAVLTERFIASLEDYVIGLGARR